MAKVCESLAKAFLKRLESTSQNGDHHHCAVATVNVHESIIRRKLNVNGVLVAKRKPQLFKEMISAVYSLLKTMWINQKATGKMFYGWIGPRSNFLA